MRADRLVSLVLLLRRHGRLSGAALARELEVSTRTVLRDIEALSTAGVPIYAERGRNGGFALLPGFRTELTGLNNDDSGGRLRLQLIFQDLRHAEWALWQVASHSEVLAPQWLRSSLHDRAAAIATPYSVPS